MRYYTYEGSQKSEFSEIPVWIPVILIYFEVLGICSRKSVFKLRV